MRLPLSAVVLAVVGALAVSSAHATTIAQFGFDEGSLYSIASTDSDPNSTAAFVLNGPLGVTTEAGTGNPIPGLMVSLPDASGGALFQSFIIALTPEAGSELNLSSLEFDARRLLTSDGASSAVYLAAVRSNLDGYASDIGSVSWTATHETDDWVTLAMDLSGAALQGLSAEDLASVGGSLRLMLFFGVTSDPQIPGVNENIDNVIVTGTVPPPPVPEPSAALLLAPALLALAGRRRLVGAR